MTDKLFSIFNDGFNEIMKVVTDTSKNLSNVMKAQEEINSLERELEENSKELECLYAQLGEVYYKNLSKAEEENVFEIDEILPLIKEKTDNEIKIRENIVKAENNLKDVKKSIEKQKLEEEFNKKKEKLDNALRENIINQVEYDEKLASYQHKLDLSDEIIRINEQYNLGIINEEERDLKIDNLLKK